VARNHLAHDVVGRRPREDAASRLSESGEQCRTTNPFARRAFDSSYIDRPLGKTQ